MKTFRLVVMASLFSMFFVESFSQVTSIPDQAKVNFAKQYPGAQNVRWDNDVVNVNVRFDLDGEKMNAEYNNKGIWKHTYTESSFDKLPAAVTEGFKKSKYADREVTEVVVVDLPGNVKQYRIRAEKNDVQKKFLYFNPEGRLIRDANTI
jgi:hypothetical protein